MWGSAYTTVPIESANLVSIADDSGDVIRALRLTRATYKQKIQGLLRATRHNAVAIPLAAGQVSHPPGLAVQTKEAAGEPWIANLTPIHASQDPLALPEAVPPPRGARPGRNAPALSFPLMSTGRRAHHGKGRPGRRQGLGAAAVSLALAGFRALLRLGGFTFVRGAGYSYPQDDAAACINCPGTVVSQMHLRLEDTSAYGCIAGHGNVGHQAAW